ncbi:hypothetical protein PLICRDRAFT_47899 [Plicaturopsis crispa FD-325 SS-3]|nr:hypothetical protein PLICRDRAFT_47899 [Plicaturopsis crispa FD-325 SS-3]
MYMRASPAQSTTSLSDADDLIDDPTQSAFNSDPQIVVSPAQWSHKRLPSILAVDPTTPLPPHSPIGQLPPEILIHILRHLHSPRDLYRALIVSRSWCECSVELLWHKPSFSKLPTLVKMMRVISRSDQTFTYARFIRRLNFLFLGPELTDALFSRLAQCDRLERLTLALCTSVSDEALTRVLSSCPALVAIDLTNVSNTTDSAIVALASTAKRLQGINLAGCKKVTNKGVFALAQNCELLRRVKLSGLDSLTDEPIQALARLCPLLLEIDLNHCKRITDLAVRDLWVYSHHMREMRLSHCAELTDLAFPAPPTPSSASDLPPPAPNPFPASTNRLLINELPPLVINRSCEHLRMLDVTACSKLTDDAVDGIVAHAPKIRNLVFSKCTQLSDRTVETICSLGKHLHYLHLGHASTITDRSVRVLARCCTRLRYVDFANCVLLTDMSVFELSSLPKLRRIGLVRVNNLTDEAIYALAERHATLERIHLSYCDQISVMAIHFLVQKLHKLTHLSLTGIPSFRQTELQKFCRPPPSEFNSSQRLAFCVYSGSGVIELRKYLADLFTTITDAGMADETDDDGHERFDGPSPNPLDDDDMGDEGDEEDEDEETFRDDDHYADHREDEFHRIAAPPPQLAMYRGHHPPPSAVAGPSRQQAQAPRIVRPPHPSPSVVVSRSLGTPSNIQRPSPQRPVAGPSSGAPMMRTFGSAPVVESVSPTPSEHSGNSAGFFRSYHQHHHEPRSGVLTPDLNYAEIGHGRVGTQPQVLADASNSWHSAPWPHPETRPAGPASPSRRDLHDSVHHALGAGANGNISAEHAPEGRGRSVKRSLRNTMNVAEHYASSLFGRGPNHSGHPPEGGAGPSSGPSTGGDIGRY